MTKKIRVPLLTDPGQEIQKDFSGKFHDEHVTGELYILIEIDRYCKWPLVWMFKSTEARDHQISGKFHQPSWNPGENKIG